MPFNLPPGCTTADIDPPPTEFGYECCHTSLSEVWHKLDEMTTADNALEDAIQRAAESVEAAREICRMKLQCR